MITELLFDTDKKQPYMMHYIPIAVKDYGAGCEPVDVSECAVYKESGGPVSCVGHSGNNMCGRFMGHLSNYVVRCARGSDEQ